jgi:selenocysteine-specific elongation factor
MFHKTVKKAKQGDRVGILITNIESKQIERGIACFPGYLKPVQRVIISFEKIKYFKFPIKSKSKYHISSGHGNT